MTPPSFAHGDGSRGMERMTRNGKSRLGHDRKRRPLPRLCCVASLVASAALAAAVDADARPRTLDREEVVELLSGNTVYGFDPRTENEFSMFHSGRGRVRAELRNVNRRTDRSDGRWWVTDEGKLCVDWASYRWVDSCVTVVRDGDSVTFVDDGGRIVSFGEMAPGNPDDL